MEKNLTALVSCFARAYHDKNYTYKIFRDEIASKILSEEEYDNIAKNMAQGIRFLILISINLLRKHCDLL